MRRENELQRGRGRSEGGKMGGEGREGTIWRREISVGGERTSDGEVARK